MGPAVVLKSFFNRRFSIVVFGTTQVLIDLEPLFALLTGVGRLHGHSHTYVAAIFIALGTTTILKISFEKVKLLNPLQFNWTVGLVSGFIGTISHVALDSIMHTDITPLAPFAETNSLHGILSLRDLHLFLELSFVVGCGIYLLGLTYKKIFS